MKGGSLWVASLPVAFGALDRARLDRAKLVLLVAGRLSRFSYSVTIRNMANSTFIGENNLPYDSKEFIVDTVYVNNPTSYA